MTHSFLNDRAAATPIIVTTTLAATTGGSAATPTAVRRKKMRGMVWVVTCGKQEGEGIRGVSSIFNLWGTVFENHLKFCHFDAPFIFNQ